MMHGRASRAGSSLIVVFLGILAVAPFAGCARNRDTQAGRPAAATPMDDKAKADRAYRAGQRAVAEGDLELALAEFQRAIDVNPELTGAHLAIGDLYRMQGEYVRAEGAYRRAAQVDPKAFAAQYYHGLMLHLLNRVTEAIQAYLRALAIEPDDFRTNLNLGQAYYQLDENNQALRYALRAVEINPRDGNARLSLGAVYGALGRHREAVLEYTQASELMDITPKLLLKWAESLGVLNRWTEMASALERVVQVDPSPLAYERLGVAMFRMERYDDALSNFEKALAIDPDYYQALNGRGVCLLNRWLLSNRQDQTSREQGLASLRRSVKVRPNQPEVIDLLTRYGR